MAYDTYDTVKSEMNETLDSAIDKYKPQSGKKWLIAGVGAAAIIAGIALSGKDAGPEYIPGELVVKFEQELELTIEADGNVDTQYDAVDALNDMLQGERYEQWIEHSDVHDMDQWYIISVDKDLNIEKLMEQFADANGVVSVERNGWMSPDYFEPDLTDEQIASFEEMLEADPRIPNDPYYHTEGSWKQNFKDLYGLHNTQAAEAWSITTGDENMLIAVSDTGVDPNHPDFEGRVVEGYNFTNDTTDAMDDHGHGTHVAGTIAAKVNNGVGIAGATVEGKILPLKVCNASGQCSWTDVARSFVYAADKGASVVNVSLGSRGSTPDFMDEAIRYATAEGTYIVTSAGNSNDDSKNWLPANHPLVFAIAATDHDDEKASFSNHGEKVDVGAPGVDILSLMSSQNRLGGRPKVGDIYVVLSGTSMASPHAVADVALILATNPEIDTWEELRDVLRAGVDEYEKEQKKPIGTGRINYYLAVQEAQD